MSEKNYDDVINKAMTIASLTMLAFLVFAGIIAFVKLVIIFGIS